MDNYIGKDFNSIDGKFPYTITTTSDYKKETILEGTLVGGKYYDYNHVECTYVIDNFLVNFHLNWDDLQNKFIASFGTEVYYRIKFILSQESKEDMENNPILEQWRLEEKQREEENPDIINTTYFSVIMNCEFYQQDKNLTQKELVRRYKEICPDGNIEEDYAHLATYHIEPHQVDYLTSTFIPEPVVYPVFIPKKPLKKAPTPPRRRDDLNGNF